VPRFSASKHGKADPARRELLKEKEKGTLYKKIGKFRVKNRGIPGGFFRRQGNISGVIRRIKIFKNQKRKTPESRNRLKFNASRSFSDMLSSGIEPETRGFSVPCSTY
jgi:hypothetical protein